MTSRIVSPSAAFAVVALLSLFGTSGCHYRDTVAVSGKVQVGGHVEPLCPEPSGAKTPSALPSSSKGPRP